MYTYPYRVNDSNLSTEDIHRLMGNPSLLARRVAKLASSRFIADFLLRGRYQAVGGSVLYWDSAEPVEFAKDEPLAIAPGGEYPLTTVAPEGTATAAKTVKWGHDSEVYDETIARSGMDPVNRTLAGLVNSVVKHVDSVSLAVVQSKVTRTYDVTSNGGAAFTSAEGIIDGILMAQAYLAEQGDSTYNYSTVLLGARQYARIQGALIKEGMLPREAGNPVLTGAPINAFGLTYVTSPFRPFTDPVLLDPDALGGMADEDLGSPGYARTSSTEDGPAVSVETKVQRLAGSDDRDGYRLRARRVTVPVVTDPNAAIRLVNTGI